LRTLTVGAALLGGCGEDKPGASATTNPTASAGNTEGASETGAMTDEPPPVTTGGGTTGAPPTTGSGMTDGSTGVEFLQPPDMIDGFQCDIWMEDCPEGQKCMPWDNTGGGSWNATKCSPINANPGQEGDECTVEGSATSGIDSCDKHLLCWYVNDMNIGTCINMCTGSEEAPSCPGGQSCDVSNMGSLILCLETCDPLVQSCPDGQICFFDGVDQFICDFDASGEEGQYGDPCAFINVCDYGLFCAAPESVPDCVSGDGCCSPYCNITEPNTCPGAPQQQCVPWWNEGEAPPGQENIGACAIPN